jgi:hypothetical protein
MGIVTGDRLTLLYWALGDLSTSEQANGVEEEKLVRRCACVTKLELFMNTLPDAACLADYPNLKELQLHVQIIPKPIGLTGMGQLQRLCMTEVKLTTMRGIEPCTQLTHLDLSSNRLTAMEPAVLGSLTNLRTLWLNENPITAIQGLERLTRLHSLWLARTQISCIGDALESNAALTDLNLAASNICNFKDIPYLTRLRLLSSLSFTDSHFGDSPVCTLCNYHTYILFHLPQLNILDSLIIADEARQVADATFMKKKMCACCLLLSVRWLARSGLTIRPLQRGVAPLAARTSRCLLSSRPVVAFPPLPQVLQHADQDAQAQHVQRASPAGGDASGQGVAGQPQPERAAAAEEGRAEAFGRSAGCGLVRFR